MAGRCEINRSLFFKKEWLVAVKLNEILKKRAGSCKINRTILKKRVTGRCENIRSILRKKNDWWLKN